MSWPRRPLGETLAVRRLLVALGWRVLPIAKHDWAAMPDAKRRAVLARLVNHAKSGDASLTF
jgi:hypothetical protein